MNIMTKEKKRKKVLKILDDLAMKYFWLINFFGFAGLIYLTIETNLSIIILVIMLLVYAIVSIGSIWADKKESQKTTNEYFIKWLTGIIYLFTVALYFIETDLDSSILIEKFKDPISILFYFALINALRGLIELGREFKAIRKVKGRKIRNGIKRRRK